jgi:methionyl-tRNA formyltransferase
VTNAEKITAEDRRLDPQASPAALDRRVRALSPHIAAYLELPDGARLQVLRARPLEQSELGMTAASELPHPGQLAVSSGGLLFGCAGGVLELLRVKPAGGREMDATDYARGHRPADAAESMG